MKVPRIGIFGVICGLGAMLFLGNCRGKEEKRSFSEVKGFDSPVQTQAIQVTPSDAPMAGMPAGHGGGGKLQWRLPDGWQEFPGTGMRMAVVKTSESEGADECTIVSLSGQAGGLSANVERWLGQLNLALPEDHLEKFLAGQQKIRAAGGFDLTLIDFGSLVLEDGSPSMLVGVVDAGQNTYFIKLVGKRENLAKAKKDFTVFCQSLTFNS